MSNHPELALLLNYANDSSASEFNNIKLHLAQCEECRTQVDSLMAVKQLSQTNSNSLSELQHQHIADYIDDTLDAATHQQIKKLIDTKPEAMKAALHYASHKSAMDKALNSKSVISPAYTYSDFILKLKSLFTFQTPIWFTVPVSAALVALLSFNILNQPDVKVPYTIASYQDNPVIQFRSKDQLPGIGFFAKTDQHTQVYDGLKVTVSDDKLFTLEWPPIKDALKYSLRLQMFDEGKKTTLGEVTTSINSATIPTQINNIYHRYEWVLSGETRDNRVFMANGGFVINHSNKVQ